jgi:hypothetical protein
MLRKLLNVVLGGGYRSSVGPITLKMKKCDKETRTKGIFYTQQEKPTGLVTSCVGTAF